MLGLLQSGTGVYVARGELDEARRLHEHVRVSRRLDRPAGSGHATTPPARCCFGPKAELAEALEAGARTIEFAGVLGPTFQGIKHGVVDAIEAAVALGDLTRADELFAFVDGLPLAERSPYVDAEVARIRARLVEDATGLAARRRRSAGSRCRSRAPSRSSSTRS